ncbi:hypothetical protein BJ123_10886 [Rhodopseudomonas thermotolerans]|jgi:acetyl-CoA carboxylase alpha subunit|uniref:Uncharacterized protein n=2 Tax=Rhodopseudomonas TaxID=1073 RepID=A0A336JPS2_9BRAD|nr:MULTISPECIES: hypothetical protein [Rhodopseudomonas]RED36153.1 hypothetical protein BJ125_10886 [Rhodopseudomonas pentothenatexigens]REG03525.1 hypothetical protein BJ123_10886 [Rhodopseudomonas thermotolerans]SSW90713.1 hypothetical protein SAMN05892882_10886 [Rhodopseudomonas pentothenatexigens]
MPTPLDKQIDRIVAESGGSVHEALRALMQVNEHLEAELARLRAAVIFSYAVGDGGQLH